MVGGTHLHYAVIYQDTEIVDQYGLEMVLHFISNLISTEN